MSRTHKDLEFAVSSGDPRRGERTFRTFDAAAGFACALSAGGEPDVCVDVLCYSPAGARFWGGDDAAESYRENPDASVFERIIIRAESRGRIA